MYEEDKTGCLEMVAKGRVEGMDDAPPADGAEGEKEEDSGDQARVVGTLDHRDDDVDEAVDEGEVNGD